MKRKVALVLSLILCLSSILTGCGKKQAAPVSDVATEEPAQASAEEEFVLEDQIVIYDNLRFLTTILEGEDKYTMTEEIIGDNLYYKKAHEFNSINVLCFNGSTYIKFVIGDDSAKFKIADTDNFVYEDVIKEYNTIVSLIQSSQYAGDDKDYWVFYANNNEDTENLATGIYSIIIPKGADPFTPTSILYTENDVTTKVIDIEFAEAFSADKLDLIDCVEISKEDFNAAYHAFTSQSSLVNSKEDATKFHAYLEKKFGEKAESEEVAEDEDGEAEDADTKEETKADEDKKEDAKADEDAEAEDGEGEGDEEAVEESATPPVNESLLTKLFMQVINADREVRKAQMMEELEKMNEQEAIDGEEAEEAEEAVAEEEPKKAGLF